MRRGGVRRTHAHAIYDGVFNTLSTMFKMLKVFSSCVDKLLKDFVENDSKAVYTKVFNIRYNYSSTLIHGAGMHLTISRLTAQTSLATMVNLFYAL